MFVGEVADEVKRGGMPRIESGLAHDEVALQQRGIITHVHRDRGDLRGAVPIVGHDRETRLTEEPSGRCEADGSAVGYQARPSMFRTKTVGERIRIPLYNRSRNRSASPLTR